MDRRGLAGWVSVMAASVPFRQGLPQWHSAWTVGQRLGLGTVLHDVRERIHVPPETRSAVGYRHCDQPSEEPVMDAHGLSCRRRHAVAHTVIRLAFLAGACMAASLLATPCFALFDEPSNGPLRTSAVDLELTRADAPARGESSRDISIKVRYPVDAKGPLPLVIFSHGMGGSSEAFGDLADRLASHGYVVILPTHSDSVKLRREQGEEAGREILSNPADYVRNVKVFERVDDIKRIIDAIPVIETKTPDLTTAGATLSRDAIAMAGHSAGALTTQMVIGAKVRTRLLGGVESVADPRVKAAVVISGQGLKNRLLTEESWAAIDKPMLVITGSRDTARVGSETPASRRHPFEYAPASKGEPRTFLLWIEGATHSSYQGRSAAVFLGEKPGDAAMVAAITSSTVLAFLDAFVKHQADSAAAQAARSSLTSDVIAKQSGGQATLSSK